MRTETVPIDALTFARTADLFVAKRDTLSPDAVHCLATEIVKRLSQAPTRHPAPDHGFSVTPESMARFCDALVQPRPDEALRFIERRRAEGASREAIRFGYVAGAARKLGEAWENDRLSFVDVTIGTGHLYALMRALRSTESSHAYSDDQSRRALFATVPGEDHGIGITMATDLFRDADWEIDLQVDKDHDALVDHAIETSPAVIGLSLSAERWLDSLVRLVVALRLVLPRSIIGVAPPSVMSETTLHRLVDIDLVFRDARTARLQLEELVRLNGQQHPHPD